ncbi:MAG: ABC transporter permease [Acidimicrobiales bacterium]|nr:ABC transporter permease [Acidimicrobiales bacterium]
MVPRQRNMVAAKDGKSTVTLATAITSASRYVPLVRNFARRELKARYKRSVLGWTWSLLSPLSTILVYSLVFSVFFRAAPPAAGNGSQNFAVFLFTGLVVWLLFAGMINGSMGWLMAIGDLRRKVFFPPETAIFGSALALAVQSAIEAGVLLIVMLLIGNIGPTTLLLPIVLALAGIFGLGLGFFVCVLNTHYRDVQYLVGIVLNALFFLVPIVYPLGIIPERHWGLPIRRIVELNPINQFVAAARESAYLLQWPSLSRWCALVCYSFAVFALGWRFFAQRSMQLSEDM